MEKFDKMYHSRPKMKKIAASNRHPAVNSLPAHLNSIGYVFWQSVLEPHSAGVYGSVGRKEKTRFLWLQWRIGGRSHFKRETWGSVPEAWTVCIMFGHKKRFIAVLRGRGGCQSPKSHKKTLIWRLVKPGRVECARMIILLFRKIFLVPICWHTTISLSDWHLLHNSFSNSR